ncbi:hypothetical protein J7438_05520 [Thalassotalea sp. G20_0]|uniref:hypothetical protein n=1 Tax=Thalassotalea sp. G20_0 TaxID=2821093 RepID=UPI001AD991DC|nr:hypothetical protein [Thalassotalea sp. G20_0]MBO9493545.1 hypothetical protein [Thalassotalea sp. G20_0]
MTVTDKGRIIRFAHVKNESPFKLTPSSLVISTVLDRSRVFPSLAGKLMAVCWILTHMALHRAWGHSGDFTPSRPSQKAFHFCSDRIAAEHLIGAHIDVASG